MKNPGSVNLLRSVRFRIAAWNALVVAVASIIAVVGLRQAIQWTLTREVDQVLQEDCKEVGLVISELADQGIDAIVDELSRKVAGHEQHRWFVQLLGVNGKNIWNSGLPEGLTEEKIEAAELVPRSLGENRFIVAPAPENRLGIVTIRLGSSMRLMRDDMAHIDRLLLAAVVLILAIAPFCGYGLAGLATDRLEKITATAASLRPSQMNERLPTLGVNDEFDYLSDTINHLLDQIADFIQEKRVFLADAAHELRTPIAAVRASVEVTLSSERSMEDYRDLLEQILDEAETMEVLVNQVLLLSEAEASVDHAPAEELSFSNIVSRSVEIFKGVAESRGIDLRANIGENITLHGVKQHLGQLVNNLIDNAIKYTGEGGTVEVILEALPGQIRLIVRDTGTGIAKEVLPRIFDRFYRGDLARRRDATRGTGLGLSICKSIVDAHSGVISCESELGQGSEFTVILSASS